MEKKTKNRIVAVRPATRIPVFEVRNKIINELDEEGLPYIHVGAGTEMVYAVLSEEVSSEALKEIVTSCDALVSSSGYLIPESFEIDDISSDWLERTLADHPINYDIPVANGTETVMGVCGLCGGVGTHVSPPCIKK